MWSVTVNIKILCIPYTCCFPYPGTDDHSVVYGTLHVQMRSQLMTLSQYAMIVYDFTQVQYYFILILLFIVGIHMVFC